MKKGGAFVREAGVPAVKPDGKLVKVTSAARPPVDCVSYTARGCARQENCACGQPPAGKIGDGCWFDGVMSNLGEMD